MNPDRIYREHRDEALAGQFKAPEYTTFVAMPFRDQFSYREKTVFRKIFCAAAKKATALEMANRPFAEPHRVDSGPRVALQVTEEIVVRILESHIFIADLTFQNAGVVVETGIVLGLKPTKQIILVMQGSPDELHFDINHNTVIRYDASDAVDQLATALVGAAAAFEAECDRYIESIKKTLSPEAILCLTWYGRLHKEKKTASLHMGVLPTYFTTIYGEATAKPVFQATIRELLEKRLIWTDYKKGVYSAEHGGLVDMWGEHPTELGWLLIDRTWPEIARLNAPTINAKAPNVEP